MNQTRRVTANLPEKLLREAMEVSTEGITQTLIEGLKLVRSTKAYDLGMKLKGKIKLSLDLDQSRERYTHR